MTTSVLCMVGMAAYAAHVGRAGVLAMPAALLLVCAGLAWHRALSSQLLLRAVLWCNLMIGMLMSIDGGGDENVVGCVVALATGTALLLLGKRGLHHTSERFSPAAFRGPLMLAMVMALADAQSLGLFGLARANRGKSTAIVLLACTALMLVALYGLFRLRVWGLVLNIIGNLVVAGLAIGGGLDIPDTLVVALCATAAVQLVLPVPVLVAMVRGRAPESTPPHPLRAWVVPVMLVAMQALAVAGYLMQS